MLARIPFPAPSPVSDSASAYALSDWPHLMYAPPLYKFYTTMPLQDLCHPVGATESFAEAAGFSIFPNPAQTSVQVRFAQGLRKQGYLLRIVDLSGAVRLRTRIPGHGISEIALVGLGAGLYLMEMQGDDGTVARERLLKL